MYQRKAKTHSAALSDDIRISLSDLIRFCKAASIDLEKQGDADAALRFEILGDYLTTEFKERKLMYRSTMLGL